MILNKTKQAAENLWAQGVDAFYIIMPDEPNNFFDQGCEQSIIDTLKECNFRHIESRRLLRSRTKFSNKKTISKLACLEIVSADAVIIAIGSEKDSTCLLEIMIAKLAGKHLLNEYLEPAERFNSLEIKFNSDEKSM